MSLNNNFSEPSRASVEAMRGPAVVEFGARWCGHCQAAQPSIEAARARHPDIAYVRVEDGPGKPLGRSFRVKLWPTLIFLRDGQEVDRLVRPAPTAVQAAFDQLSAPPAAT